MSSSERVRLTLVAMLSCAIVLCATGTVAAQAPQPAVAPPAAPALPSLLILDAALHQRGEDLQLRMHFSRPLRPAQLVASRGRFVCLVLGPGTPSARGACVSRRAGHLRVTLTPLDAGGLAAGRGVVLGRARVIVAGGYLELRAPARSLRVALGRRVSWQALVSWRDGDPCELDPSPAACTQLLPATGARELLTRATRRPAFARDGHLRMLATGDSMIQIVDGFLKQRLQRRRATSVRSDARISTGISKPAMLDWVRKAREQARSLHPDVTAIFIGANDGFPMKTPGGASVACCGAGWVAEYARRVEAMMRSYLRGGRSLVYWMTLPTPRRGDFARVYRAVNTAIRRAGGRVGAGARVIDLVAVFTPGGRFRQYVTFRGRTVNARQADGVHLSVAGASIAATLLIDRLRADHALPRVR
jgi:lysophospholipase L1-like esterase